MVAGLSIIPWHGALCVLGKNNCNRKIKEHGIARLAVALRILQRCCALCWGIAHPAMVLVLHIVAQ